MSDPKPKSYPEARAPFWWQTIAYRDGDLGDQLDRVKAALEKDARAAGAVVTGWEMSPARVLSVTQEQHGVDKELKPLFRTKRMCEVTVLALTAPLGPERWVRVTHKSGPTAAEVLEVPPEAIRKLQGLGCKRTMLHPVDIRGVAMGYAQRALEESGQ